MKVHGLFLVMLACAFCLVHGDVTLSLEKPTEDPPAEWTESTGQDDFDRVLRLRTNRFSGTYAVDQPIPVAIEVVYAGSRDPDEKKGIAQLHPNLNAWIKLKGGKFDGRIIRLAIENRNLIKLGKKFEHVFDLRKELNLTEPGVYRISVGHESHYITDSGDWTGTLKSAEQIVRLVDPAAKP